MPGWKRDAVEMIHCLLRPATLPATCRTPLNVLCHAVLAVCADYPQKVSPAGPRLPCQAVQDLLGAAAAAAAAAVSSCTLALFLLLLAGPVAVQLIPLQHDRGHLDREGAKGRGETHRGKLSVLTQAAHQRQAGAVMD